MSKTVNQLVKERDATIIEIFGSFEAFNQFRKENPNMDPLTLSEKIKPDSKTCSCCGNGDMDYHWNYNAWK